MVEAYVLVKIPTQTEMQGYNQSVVEKLLSISGVDNVELLFGDYDAIVKLSLPKIHDCENLIIEELSMIEGVGSTVTLLCVDDSLLEKEN
jgi:DNA-binding Lrp family transcriptional regulator